MTRALSFTSAALILVVSVAVQAQEKPLPKPVTPPVPIPGTNPPPVPNNNAPPRPPIGAGAEAQQQSVIAPFLDNQTLGVIRIDLQQVDLKAIQDWVNQGLEDLRKSDKSLHEARMDLRQELGKLFSTVDRLKAAGVKRMFLVVSLEDLTSDRPPFAVFPLDEGVNADAVEDTFRDVIRSKDQPAGADEPQTRRIQNSVVVGLPATLDRLKAAVPAARPELNQAFEAAGPGQIHLALIPQEGARKLLESASPTLPDELGGGPIDTISRGVQWAALTIGLPPRASFRFVIQGADAKAAAKLEEVAKKAIAWAGDRKHGPMEALAFTRLVSNLQPKLERDRVIIEMDADHTRELAATFAASLLSARTQAQRVTVMTNMRQISIAVIEYANDMKDAMPKDLGDDINQYLSQKKLLWTDPLRPNQQKPYVYLHLANKMSDIKDPAQAIMIYENHSTWDNGINVAFADGHVEWISDEGRFKQILDATKKSNPGATEMPQ